MTALSASYNGLAYSPPPPYLRPMFVTTTPTTSAASNDGSQLQLLLSASADCGTDFCCSQLTYHC